MTRFDTLQRAFILTCIALAVLVGCRSRGSAIDGQTVPVACGRCIFDMPGVTGCPWAVEIDGKHYLVQGSVPEEHSTHAPDGICNLRRQAVVDGRVEGDRFVATRLDLLPAVNVPKRPRYAPTDVH